MKIETVDIIEKEIWTIKGILLWKQGRSRLPLVASRLNGGMIEGVIGIVNQVHNIHQ